MKFDPDTPGVYPSAVYDADGREIPWIISGDTETGEVVVSIRDREGKPMINHMKGECVRERRRYKAPLTLRRIEPGADHVMPSKHPPFELLGDE